MKTKNYLMIVIALSAALAACMPSPQSGRGFRLPDGDAERGKTVFVNLQCHACHTIPGVQLSPLKVSAPVSVTLGGPVSRVQTYGQLVTSIINPSHKLINRYPKEDISVDGETFMPDMNDYLTVRQLIDLVAFLQGEYELVVPEAYPYGTYTY